MKNKYVFQNKIINCLNQIINVIVVFVVSLLYLVSCENDIAILNDNTIEFSEFIQEDSVSFSNLCEYTKGIPRTFHVVDSVLIIFDRNKSSEFVFYNYKLNEGEFSNGYLRRGKGPNEAIGAWWSGIYRNKLWVFDLTTKKILTIDIAKVLSVPDSIELSFTEYRFKKQYYRMDFVDSLTCWIVGFEETRSKISVVEMLTGNEIDEVGRFGRIPKKVPLPAFKDAYTSYIFSKPSGGKVVLPYRYTDVIEIYDVKEHTSKAVKGPVGFDVEYRIRKNRGGYYMSKVKETRKAFQSGVVTENFIYLLYSGHYYEEDNWSNGRYIYVYDWDGNPIRELVLDRYIDILGVSDDDKTLYSFDNKTGYIIKADIY